MISTKLLAGRTVVHVYSDVSPGAGVRLGEADLEDVYFSTMAGHFGRPSATAGAGGGVMKFLEVFRFELAYQSRRVSTWLFFVVLLAITFHLSREAFIEKAHRGGYFFNSSTLISEITVLTSLMALLVSATLAGDAAARDVQTRMHPLVYTTPVGKGAYLGGRFLAAFVLNALILLAVPIGSPARHAPAGPGARGHRPVPAGGLPRCLFLHRGA